MFKQLYGLEFFYNAYSSLNTISVGIKMILHHYRLLSKV